MDSSDKPEAPAEEILCESCGVVHRKYAIHIDLELDVFQIMIMQYIANNLEPIAFSMVKEKVLNGLELDKIAHLINGCSVSGVKLQEELLVQIEARTGLLVEELQAEDGNS